MLMDPREHARWEVEQDLRIRKMLAKRLLYALLSVCENSGKHWKKFKPPPSIAMYACIRWYEEEKEWLLDDTTDEPFSCMWVCDLLKLDYSVIRRLAAKREPLPFFMAMSGSGHGKSKYRLPRMGRPKIELKHWINALTISCDEDCDPHAALKKQDLFCD